MESTEAQKREEAKAALLAEWTKQRDQVGRWIRPLLLPFIVYVAMACPLALLIPAYDYSHHNNHNLSLILPGYGVSRHILLVGGLAQLACGRVWDGVVTLACSAVSYSIYSHSWFHC